MKKLIEFLKTTLKHKIFQNFSYLVLGNVGMQALNLISVMIITKVYKPELFGLYSFITIQTILLASIADLGMRTITIRSAATDNEKLNNIFSINIISMLGANVVLIVLYYFYNLYYGELTIIQLFLVCLSSIANCYNTIVESVFLGKQKMLPVAIANVLNSTIWLLFVVLVFDSSISIDLFLLVSILIYVLKPIQLTIKLYNKYNVRFDTSNFTREFKVIFLQALPLWGLVLLSLPANFLANNFLSYNSGITEVGFFSLSQKFTSPISIVLTLMFTALFPNISLLWLNNKTDFKRIINKSIPLFILFGTFLVTVFLILIEPIFKLIFLEKYYPVLIILKFQLCSCLPDQVTPVPLLSFALHYYSCHTCPAMRFDSCQR